MRDYMKIEQLLIRTTKPDQTKEDYELKTRMERAGFIKTQEKMTFYTPLGIMFRDVVEQYIIDFLSKENFLEGHIPKAEFVSDMISNIAMINDVLVSSYKDLPVRLFYKETLNINQDSQPSLWQIKTQKILGLSCIGYEEEDMENLICKILASLLKNIVSSNDTLFYPLVSGKDTFHPAKNLTEKKQEKLNYPKNEQVKVETKGIKTVKELCGYLSVAPQDILKTMIYSHGDIDYAVIILGSLEVDLVKLSRVLGLPEGKLAPKSEASIKADLGVSPGYMGPVGLKVNEILIDHSVIKEKSYVTGSNVENYHLLGVTYGRDYTGNFYDLAKDSTERRGWVLAEKRERLPMLRVQSAFSTQEFVPLQAGYINVDRLVLALCHEAMDSKGFNFPKTLKWFQGVVTTVDPRNEEALQAAGRVYDILTDAGFKMILDDRRNRLGSKFNDYDLISIPYRIILGKSFEEEFDLKDREGKMIKVNFENVESIFKDMVKESKLILGEKVEVKDETL